MHCFGMTQRCAWRGEIFSSSFRTVADVCSAGSPVALRRRVATPPAAAADSAAVSLPALPISPPLSAVVSAALTPFIGDRRLNPRCHPLDVLSSRASPEATVSAL